MSLSESKIYNMYMESFLDFQNALKKISIEEENNDDNIQKIISEFDFYEEKAHNILQLQKYNNISTDFIGMTKYSNELIDYINENY